MYDIIIVGASVAGSTTAYRLKSKGYSVLLMDKEYFPRDKPCGDGLTTAMLREIPYRIPPKLLSERVTKARIISYSNEVINFNFAKGGIYTSPRLVFDDYLLSKAKKIGVQVIEGARVIDIKPHKKGYQVFSTKGEYFGKILIGADGFFSIVNKKANIQPNIIHEKSQYRFGIRGYLPDKSLLRDENTIEFYMDRSIDFGYGWLFPVKNGINIGVGGIMSNGKSMKDLFYQFCNRVYSVREREFNRDDVQNTKGHYIPIGGFSKNFAKDNILLVGDAARLVDPFSGEGMQSAVKSGKIAANVIHAKFNQNENIEKYYNKQMYQGIYKNLRIGLRVGNFVNAYFERFFTIMKFNPTFNRIFSMIVSGEINYEYMLRHSIKMIPKLAYNSLKVKLSKEPPKKNYFNSNIKSIYNNNSKGQEGILKSYPLQNPIEPS